MGKWKKIILGVVTTLGILLAAIVIGVNYLFSDMCGAQAFKTISSPNGDYKAVIFEYDCGATTGFSTQVSILDYDEALGNKSGNIYTSDGDPDSVAPIVTWTDNTHLNIQNNAHTHIYKHENSWGWPWKKIEITYN